VTQVAQRLGVTINSLSRACPELYARLSLRHPDRRSFQIAKVEDALKNAFEESPASLVQLASRLHRNADKLRLTSPELCADLHQRYIAHQSMERRRLDLIYEEYVRETISEIVAAGKYPSRERVLSFITMKDPLLTSIHLTGRALKRIRPRSSSDRADNPRTRGARTYNHKLTATDYNHIMAILANLSL